MLVLHRRTNDSIRIGEDIKILVVDIRCDKVRLGIEAPPGVSVHRREVFDAMKRASGTVHPGLEFHHEDDSGKARYY